MRILILTQYYPPELGAPQGRLSELAIRLRAVGHTVRVLTAIPNYPTGTTFEGYRGRLRLREEIDGIEVRRTWIYPSSSGRLLRRLQTYLSFTISSVLLGAWGLGKHDILIFESPPLTLVPSAFLLGLLTRSRVIMNVSDIWPDLILRLGHRLGAAPRKLLLGLERFGYRSSAAVTVTTPGARDQLLERFPGLRVAVISNGVDLDRFRPDLASEDLRQEMGAEPNQVLVGYFGLYGFAQGLEIVLEAAHMLRDRPQVRFVLVGDGPCRESLLEVATRLDLENLRFLPRLPREGIPPYLASCDLILAPLASRLPGTMPSKIFEALASGVPAIFADGCEAGRLLSDPAVGRSYEPGRATTLAEAILEAMSVRLSRAQRARRCRVLAQLFDRDRIAEHTGRVLTAVALGEQLPATSYPWDEILSESANPTPAPPTPAL